ncbi:hypothetical protein Pcac1_g1273 [Phytophthora cactorum]|nr:hypothetical protein Pcac1_g1273 [Phytophthora cactorum]KAG2802659.1 hypothetical protein PC111_g19010 [Phytophthora cactorum]KAG2981490.1 hypothetical protein PC120_g24797 [Phytophthora cactorum]
MYSAFAGPKTKSFETSFYSPSCSDDFGGQVPLCHQIRREETGNTNTCSQIWHKVWSDGKAIAANLSKIATSVTSNEGF